MKCENGFCIYQENDECLLEEISLDILGQCTDCIYIDLEEKTLNQVKEYMRKRLCSRD